MGAGNDSRLGLMLLYKGSDAIYKSFLASFAANIITGAVLITLGLSPFIFCCDE